MQEASTDKVSTLSSFLQSCLKLLRNQHALGELQKVIASCEPQQSFGQEKAINRVRRTSKEMRLNAHIGEDDMTDVLGSVNSLVAAINVSFSLSTSRAGIFSGAFLTQASAGCFSLFCAFVVAPLQVTTLMAGAGLYSIEII